MPRGQYTFRQRDVTAALKAARDAGIEVAGLKMHKDGDFELVFGRADTTAEPDPTAEPNELDEAS